MLVGNTCVTVSTPPEKARTLSNSAFVDLLSLSANDGVDLTQYLIPIYATTFVLNFNSQDYTFTV